MVRTIRPKVICTPLNNRCNMQKNTSAETRNGGKKTMSEKEDILQEILWLGIYLFDDNLDEADICLNKISEYIIEEKV